MQTQQPHSTLHSNEVLSTGTAQNHIDWTMSHKMQWLNLDLVQHSTEDWGSWSEGGVLPGLIPPYLSHDAFHPHQVFAHHWEELHLVGYWSDLDTTGLTRVQQLLPGLHHFLLFDQDGVSLLTSVNGSELSSILLQLPHLHQDRMNGVNGLCTEEWT